MPTDHNRYCAKTRERIESKRKELRRKVAECRQIRDPQERALCQEVADGMQESLNALQEEYALECASPPPPPGEGSFISLQGLELTQSIQFFSIAGTGAGLDNANELVAGKDLLVRAYVRNDTTGNLTIDGNLALTPIDFLGDPGNKVWFDALGYLARPSAVSTRDPLAGTMNFRIPAAHCQGTIEISVQAWMQGRQSDAASRSQTVSLRLRFTHNGQPILMVHRIAFTFTQPTPGGPVDTRQAEPSLADCQATFDLARRMFPISGFVVQDCGKLSYPTKVNIELKGDWSALHDWFVQLRNAASPTPTDNIIYVGMMQPTPDYWGFGRGGCITSFAAENAHFAHELGHALGLRHVADLTCKPGIALSDPDPDYPDYQNAIRQSAIGEFGVDLAPGAMTLHDNETPDIMSYCSNRWISPYHYRKSLLSPVLVLPNPDRRAFAGEKLSLWLRFHRGGRVELRSAYHLPGEPLLGLGDPSDYTVEIYGQNARFLFGRRLLDRYDCESDTPPYRDYHELLPWFDEASFLTVLRGDVEIARFPVADSISVPEGTRLSLREVRRASGQVNVQVSWAHLPFRPVGQVLRYSYDGGQSWIALPADSGAADAEVDLSLLPGADDCRLELVASTGVRTIRIGSEPFSRPNPSPSRALSIVTPAAGAIIDGYEPVGLVGSFAYWRGEDPSRFDAFWTSNRDGFLADGFTAAANLSPGRHALRLFVASTDGQEHSARSIVYVQGGMRRSRSVNGARKHGCGCS